MAGSIYSITRAHARVNWARGKNHKVSAEMTRELSGIKSLVQAEMFVKAAGISVDKVVSSKSAYAIWAAPPECLRPLGEKTLEFHSPQIVLPRVDCTKIPFGTALLNFLVPKIEDKSEAEVAFGEFQKAVLKFSDRIGAGPFACITGYKGKEEPEARNHDLYYRGFRFFFGPEPDALFKYIQETLEIWEAIHLHESKETATDKMKQIEKRRSCWANKEKIGHSIIYDIKLEERETQLVDLR